MKTTCLCFCMVILLFNLKAVEAFWSDPAYSTHQDITAEALSAVDPRTKADPFCFGSNCLPFSANAIIEINKRHMRQDAGLLNVAQFGVAYDPRDHFDSNLLLASLVKLAGNRDQLNSLLKGGRFTSDIQAKIWVLLGNMLHAAEDFYAHSTWVDEGYLCDVAALPCHIINFGAATKNAPNADLTIFPLSPVTYYCNPPGYPLGTLPVTYLITGFYPPATPGTGECQHGATFPSLFGPPSLLGVCAPTTFLPQTVPGISHDVACDGIFSPANTKELHESAYNLAVQEVRSFVQSIVADLVTANNSAGFCSLVDAPAGSPMCFAGTVSGSLPLQLQGGLIFPDGSTLNTVSFGVSIDANGIVSAVPVPIMFNGTTLTANNFLTDCPIGPATGTSTCVPFGKSYDWPLSPTTLCLGDGKNACGPVGAATLTLAYQESGDTPDGADQCNITINLSAVGGVVNAVAAQGSVCNYRGKGISTLLMSGRAVCFNEPAGMVCP